MSLISKSQFCRLCCQQETLERWLEQYTLPLLCTPAPEGKWNALEQAAHLTCYQIAFLKRIQRILEEVEPGLPRYVAEEDELFEQLRSEAPESLLHRLRKDRKNLVDLLVSVPADGHLRRARHPVYGLLDLTEWTEMFLLHEAHHLLRFFFLMHRHETADL